MVSLAGLYGGGRGSASAAKIGSSSGAWRAPAPVRQLYWRVRKAVLRRPRRDEARFGYDLQSYSRNFDDGELVSAY